MVATRGQVTLFDRGVRQSDHAILSVLPHPARTSISTSNASTPTTDEEQAFDGIARRDVVFPSWRLQGMISLWT
jgi:hypothetical protein